MRTFIIAGRIPSLNEWANGRSWQGKTRVKKQWMKDILNTLMVMKVPKLKTPIFVKAIVRTVRERDIDNGILAIKFCLDSLVKGHYIVDDKSKYVCGIGLGWKKSNDSSSEQVEFTIEETV